VRPQDGPLELRKLVNRGNARKRRIETGKKKPDRRVGGGLLLKIPIEDLLRIYDRDSSEG